jgi:hypothetical protein
VRIGYAHQNISLAVSSVCHHFCGARSFLP